MKKKKGVICFRLETNSDSVQIQWRKWNKSIVIISLLFLFLIDPVPTIDNVWAKFYHLKVAILENAIVNVLLNLGEKFIGLQ